MSRRRATPALAASVLAGALAAVPAAPAPAAPTAGPRPLVIRTVPPVAGVRLHLGRRVFTTDARGSATVRFTAADGGPDAAPEVLLRRLRAERTSLPQGGVARFTRLYPTYRGRRTARLTLSTAYRVRASFVDLEDRRVDPRLVDSYTLRSRHGAVITARGTEPVELQRSRVVFFGGVLTSRSIEWAIERVMVDGANLVNRGQQRFDPAGSNGRFKARLLFYPARFKAHDAIFGFPIGNGVRLRKPDGTEAAYAFRRRAVVDVDALPRGEYQVAVDGPGYSFERPVKLSRRQVVDLEVISYLDIAVVMLLLGGLALGLLVARRPALRRRLRHPFRGRRKLVASLAVLVMVALAVGATSAGAATRGTPTKLFAYYYIWFNPSTWNRAKADYPMVGRYSSDESSVMRRHIRLAKAASINGFVVSWKSTPLLDERLGKLIRVAREERFQLAIMYQGLDYERRPLPVEKIAADLDRLTGRFARGAVFGSFEKPVLVWSGTWEFTPAQLHRVTDTRRDDLLILGTERNADDYRAKARALDGDAYYWSSVNPRTYPNYPVKLAEMAAAVHHTGGLWIAPAAPGYDGRLVGGRTVVARDGDRTLRREMDAAQSSDPDAIGLISWNEFSENSHVEPSQRYSTTALKAIADLRGASLDVGDELDSSQPTGRGSGPNSITSVGIFLAAFGALALVVRARRRPPPRGWEDLPRAP